MLEKGKKTVVLIIVLCLVVIIVVALTFYLNYIRSNTYKFTKLGYTKEQTKELIKLNKHLDELLKIDYNPKLINILKEKYYIDKNFINYVSFAKANEDKNPSDIVAIVNVKTNLGHYTSIKETDSSKEYSILVNKYHQLPSNYAPEDIIKIKNWYAYEGHQIRNEVYNNFIEMFEQAKNNNLSIIIYSSYRTYKEQEETYELFKDRYNQEYADQYAARPGHSEHQTGLALDIIKPGIDSEEFDRTDEYKWLLDNAHKYGFILRYPKDKEYLTGYSYESWHYRYVGKDLAKKIYESKLTFDEYYAYYIDEE